MEEEPHNEDLQARHRNHEPHLHDGEVENPLLRALHREEIPVLPCAEILLVPGNGAQLGAQLEDRFLQHARLLRVRALLARELRSDFIFDLATPCVSYESLCGQIILPIVIGEPALELGRLERLEERCVWDRGRVKRDAYRDLEVHRLLRKGAHLVVEAEAVFARVVGREDEVTLALFGAVEDHLLVGARDGVVDVERAARLDLQSRISSGYAESEGTLTAK